MELFSSFGLVGRRSPTSTLVPTPKRDSLTPSSSKKKRLTSLPRPIPISTPSHYSTHFSLSFSSFSRRSIIAQSCVSPLLEARRRRRRGKRGKNFFSFSVSSTSPAPRISQRSVTLFLLALSIPVLMWAGLGCFGPVWVFLFLSFRAMPCHATGFWRKRFPLFGRQKIRQAFWVHANFLPLFWVCVNSCPAHSFRVRFPSSPPCRPPTHTRRATSFMGSAHFRTCPNIHSV